MFIKKYDFIIRKIFILYCKLLHWYKIKMLVANVVGGTCGLPCLNTCYCRWYINTIALTYILYTIDTQRRMECTINNVCT